MQAIAREQLMAGPSWIKPCDCGRVIERWFGQNVVTCPDCGAEYNCYGKRLPETPQAE